MISILVALRLLTPTFSGAEVRTHAEAVLAASREHHTDPTLLLAIAFVESRHDPYTLSYLDCVGTVCRRVARKWSSPEPPPRAKGPYFCGPMQVGGKISWDRCRLLMRDLALNYVLGAQHLQEWMDSRPCKDLPAQPGYGHLVCALRGYNGGYPSIAAGRSRYPFQVIRAHHRILRHLRRNPTT